MAVYNILHIKCDSEKWSVLSPWSIQFVHNSSYIKCTVCVLPDSTHATPPDLSHGWEYSSSRLWEWITQSCQKNAHGCLPGTRKYACDVKQFWCLCYFKTKLAWYIYSHLSFRMSRYLWIRRSLVSRSRWPTLHIPLLPQPTPRTSYTLMEASTTVIAVLVDCVPACNTPCPWQQLPPRQRWERKLAAS